MLSYAHTATYLAMKLHLKNKKKTCEFEFGVNIREYPFGPEANAVNSQVARKCIQQSSGIKVENPWTKNETWVFQSGPGISQLCVVVVLRVVQLQKFTDSFWRLCCSCTEELAAFKGADFNTKP